MVNRWSPGLLDCRFYDRYGVALGIAESFGSEAVVG